MLTRGLKWYGFRNLEGVLHPDIADDPNKMKEVNFYLEFIKDKNKNKVHKIFEKWIFTDLHNPSHKNAKMEEIAKGLDSDKILSKNDTKEDKAETKIVIEAPKIEDEEQGVE